MTPLFAFFATLFFVGFLGVFTGYFLKGILLVRKKENIDALVAKLRSDAEQKASQVLTKAEQQSQAILQKTREEVQEQKKEITDTRKRVEEKELYIEEKERKNDEQKNLLEKEKQEVAEIKISQKKILSEVSHFSQQQAKDYLISLIEKEEKDTLLVRLKKIEQENNDTVSQKAKDLLVSAIHRYGNSVENDIMSTSVKLKDDEAKGKIIGKEGRNIKTFEKVSGVQLIIDDTPGIITISSFDPIRRAIAKQALEKLLKDGRVQPARIEQVVKETKEDVIKIIEQKGKDAAIECNVNGLSDDLLRILGTLYFRYSYGQNVLQHSVEMAHIAGMLADQVGADADVARAGALLHDIGKATDHTDQGSHVDIGRRILRKNGVSDEVIKAMQSHHEEYPYETVESILVQVADSISGGRPGARSDIANMYVKKLDGLERISKSIPGVESAYALSAGREVRVFVNPEQVDDLEAKKIAREVARQIEQELKYPGEIKVHVIRESRIVDYAR